VEKTNLRWV